MVEGIQNSFLCFPGKTQWTPTLLLASDETCDQLSLLSLVNSFEALAGPASARRQRERNGGMAHVPGSASTTLRACLPQKLPKQLGLNKEFPEFARRRPRQASPWSARWRPWTLAGQLTPDHTARRHKPYREVCSAQYPKDVLPDPSPQPCGLRMLLSFVPAEGLGILLAWLKLPAADRLTTVFLSCERVTRTA